MSRAPEAARPIRQVLPLALAPVPDGDLSAYFEGLANPTRLKIVERLAQVKQARVSDVAVLLGISQPRMSWHLRLLRRAGIVTTRREGREVFCRLDREAIGIRLERFNQLLSAAVAPVPEAAPGEAPNAVNPSSAPLGDGGNFQR